MFKQEPCSISLFFVCKYSKLFYVMVNNKKLNQNIIYLWSETRESDRLVLQPLIVQKVEPGVRNEMRTEIVRVSLVHYPGIQPQQHVGEDPGDLATTGIREQAGADEPLRV